MPTGTLAFRNRGDLTFEPAGKEWGFAVPGVCQGMALADLDNDGDLDVIINRSNDEPCLFRNDTAAPRLGVRLKGLAPNTRGVGARIVVSGGAVPRQSQEMICGGRYLSCDDAMRVFAAGGLTNDLRIEVSWRSGRHTLIEHAIANRIYELAEADAAPAPNSGLASTSPGPSWPDAAHPPQETHAWFEDATARLNHRHEDELFDDFARQPLLPAKLSQLGPGLAWFDIDGDGWEDLVVGSGKSGRLAVFRNDTRGGFEHRIDPLFAQPVTRDQTGIVGLWRKDAGRTLLAGSANYEDGLAIGSPVRTYDLGRGTIEDSLPGQVSSAGPIALADMDGDGDLDLFVGGPLCPASFPSQRLPFCLETPGASGCRMCRTISASPVSGWSAARFSPTSMAMASRISCWRVFGAGSGLSQSSRGIPRSDRTARSGQLQGLVEWSRRRRF